MSRTWLQQQERGTPFAYQFMLWVARYLGRRCGRMLLPPICAYFMVCSAGVPRSLDRYLRRILARQSTLRDRYHHYHCFASTLLDRVYFLTQQQQRFQITIRGAEPLLCRVDHKEGCLLLGSHLGSFEVVRAVAQSSRDVDIKLVMHEQHAAMLHSVLQQIAPSLFQCIIPIGRPDSMLRVKECLDQGGLVGILGDRVISHERTVSCKFLGSLAQFPIGPLLMASVVQAPVFLFFGLYRGGNRYDVHFELFADRIELDRDNREQGIQDWTQRYVDRLEHYCRMAPHNWFNFYDYWNELH